MPTYERTTRFRRDLDNLAADVRGRFKACINDEFIPAMRRGVPWPPGLRIKGVRGYRGVYEMTFAPDGRATFMFGEQIHPGELHIVWRRVGSHEIFSDP